MMAASCDKNDGEGTETKEPSVTNLEGVQTAGSLITVQAENLASDAKFFLKSEDNTIEITDVTVLSSGAEIALPYNLGDFILCFEQNSITYEVGKITIAVTDVAVPDDAVVGYVYTIKGNGFASDAKIVIDEKEVETTVDATGAKIVVPDAIGEFDVKVEQAGTEQSLGKLTISTKAFRTKIGIQMDMMGDGTLTDIYSCTAGYNDNDEPVSLAVYNSVLEEYGMSNYSYLITKKENVYTFKGDMASWSFTIEDGHVKTFTYDGEDYDWVYNEDGQLTSFYVDAGLAYKIAYADGNYKQSVPGDELVTKSDEIDVTLVSEKWMEIDMNSEIYYAAVLFGWAGKPSKNYPSEIEFGPIEYTFDNGYVTSAETEMSSIICEYK